jgi:hypothetical protein
MLSPDTFNLLIGDVVPIPTHPENIATGAQTVQAKQATPVFNNSKGVN